MEQTPRSEGFRFRLRSLFILMAAVGLLSGLARSAVQGDPALALLFVGIAVFCYGGIFAITGYAFVAALLTLSTKTSWGQRASELFAAFVGASIWIAFVSVTLAKWPQVAILFSLAIILIIGWIVRNNWTLPEGPSPENSLRRLLSAKQNCVQKHSSIE